MPYNFVADSFHTKKFCSRLSSSEVRFFTQIGRFAFLRPPLGELGATYDDHLRLIGKRVVDFLLALIEFFSLGVTAEALRANIGSKSAILLQRGPVDPKFQVEGVAPTNHSSSQKTRLNDLSNDIKIWTDRSTILSQSTRLTDRQTDRRTEFSSLDRVCILCSAVKMA